MRFGGICGECGANRVIVGTISNVSFGIRRNRFTVMINTSNTNGAAILGVLNKVSDYSRNRVVINKGSVDGFGSGRLVRCEQRSVNFIFRFCGLIRGLATGRGIRLTTRVYVGPLSDRATLRDINLLRETGGFPTRLSNNRRREISVTETLTGEPGLLLYSRPANTLSCGANERVLGLLRRAYHGSGVAIILVARGKTVAPVTSRVVEVGDKGVIRSVCGRGPGGIRRVR